MALLEVRNVSKNFGAIRALMDVSFAIGPGEVVGLMGDNGAGKSTMVKLIAGNFPPSDGEVLVNGEVCHFHKPIEARAKGIEVVYQDLAIADNLTAAQNVFLGREITKGVWPFRVLDKQAMIDRSAELFAELKSETRPRDLVRKMSGGQRQAVAIALISHRMPDVFAVCDRIIVLRRGTKVADKVTAMTSPEEITGLITGAILAA
ncbi:MAG: ATP-binding cassette domain-containing protein [Alphaproteobacteria bacterium]|nr:ATP-binding cassette domain-containing protein [Alphaproteobacteria bacterium]